MGNIRNARVGGLVAAALLVMGTTSAQSDATCIRKGVRAAAGGHARSSSGIEKFQALER